MTTIDATEARQNFSETVDRVTHKAERIVVTRNGKPRAALVSISDLELLERLEDEFDVMMAREALKDRRRIPWSTVKEMLDL